MSSDTTPERKYAVDERLVMPETRFEVIDGEVVYVSPADPPHASRHSKLSALLEAYCADGYDAACDMLTRTSEKSDMAPDGSIYPLAPDPETGGRQLEELAFEVVSTARLSAAGTKAARLAARGVRRIFALDVSRRRALEWSRETDAWQMLAPDASIEDPVLAVSLRIEDLVVAAKADDAVARALIAKRNPLIEAVRESARDEGRAEGKAEGKAEAILAVLAARSIEIDARARERIERERDHATLERWLEIAVRCARAADLFG